MKVVAQDIEKKSFWCFHTHDMTFDVFLWLQHYGNLYQKSAKLAVLPRLFLLISPSKDFLPSTTF